jgi:hypothetical protein
LRALALWGVPQRFQCRVVCDDLLKRLLVKRRRRRANVRVEPLDLRRRLRNQFCELVIQCLTSDRYDVGPL